MDKAEIVDAMALEIAAAADYDVSYHLCKKYATAALTAAEPFLAQVREEAWQPIESAPKDGREILAYSEHGCTGTMLVRHLAPNDFLTDAEAEHWISEGMDEEDLGREDWFCADFLQGCRLSPDCYPTHWRPLPEPPTKLTREGGDLGTGPDGARGRA
jgi:hypothetical protein